jgi:[ribosomal protein S5]-alanine N-acetyltransferase
VPPELISISSQNLHVRSPVFTMEARSTAHAAELFDVLRDPQLYEHLDEAPPTSVNELAEKLARSEGRRSPDGKELWLNWVVRVQRGALAGYVQATVEENGETNIAYVFGRPFHGQGVASAAVRRMIDIVVAEHQASTLFIVAEAANLPSVRLAERLGFVQAPPAVAARRSSGPQDVVFWLPAPLVEV